MKKRNEAGAGESWKKNDFPICKTIVRFALSVSSIQRPFIWSVVLSFADRSVRRLFVRSFVCSLVSSFVQSFWFAMSCSSGRDVFHTYVFFICVFASCLAHLTFKRPFYSRCLVTWPMDEGEVGGDLAVTQISLLLLITTEHNSILLYTTEAVRSASKLTCSLTAI